MPKKYDGAALEDADFAVEALPKYNVIMIGIDSVSRLQSHRQLRPIRDFLLNELNTVEFFGYNKVGHNSLPNWIPFLTGWNWPGHTQEPETFQKPYRNDYIWKEYHDKGFWTVLGDGSDVFTGKHVTGWTYKVEPEALRWGKGMFLLLLLFCCCCCSCCCGCCWKSTTSLYPAVIEGPVIVAAAVVVVVVVAISVFFIQSATPHSNIPPGQKKIRLESGHCLSSNRPRHGW